MICLRLCRKAIVNPIHSGYGDDTNEIVISVNDGADRRIKPFNIFRVSLGDQGQFNFQFSILQRLASLFNSRRRISKRRLRPESVLDFWGVSFWRVVCHSFHRYQFLKANASELQEKPREHFANRSVSRPTLTRLNRKTQELYRTSGRANLFSILRERLYRGNLVLALLPQL